MSALQAILDDPRYHDYLAILKGARNGLVYGFKVRFPHALIMAILFGRGEYVPFLPLHTDVNYFIVPPFPPWTPSPPTLCLYPHFRFYAQKKSWLERLKVILRASKQHATNLAKFVAIYKSLLLLQRKLNAGKGRPHDSFFAGLLGGYLVFGERNAINEQVRTRSYCSHHPCGYAAAGCVHMRMVASRRARSFLMLPPSIMI